MEICFVTVSLRYCFASNFMGLPANLFSPVEGDRLYTLNSEPSFSWRDGLLPVPPIASLPHGESETFDASFSFRLRVQNEVPELRDHERGRVTIFWAHAACYSEQSGAGNSRKMLGSRRAGFGRYLPRHTYKGPGRRSDFCNDQQPGQRRALADFGGRRARVKVFASVDSVASASTFFELILVSIPTGIMKSPS